MYTVYNHKRYLNVKFILQQLEMNTVRCGACDNVFKTQRRQNEDNHTIVEGPQLCFGGNHTLNSLPDSDKRKIWNDVVLIDGKSDHDLQVKIEHELSPEKQAGVVILQIMGCLKPATICHHLTNLTTLRLFEVGDPINNVSNFKLHLTADLTPKLSDLELRSVPDKCDFKVVLPTLRKFSIDHFAPGHPDGDTGSINRMLAAATELEIFDAFKLWNVEELNFSSNHLKSIKLHRSESLRVLSIWAPNLEHLNLQGCYSLDRIRILTAHPILGEDLPRNHIPSKFSVNIRNANLSPSAMASLDRNSRCNVLEDVPTEGFNARDFLESMLGAMGRP